MTVTSQEEYNFLTSTFVDFQNVWIAANDLAVEGTFRWVAGPEAGQLVSMTNGLWASGQPDNYGGNEDCVEFWDRLKFNDGGCQYAIKYIIEYEGIVNVYMNVFVVYLFTCMYLYVYMYTCMYVYMYVCLCMYVCE